MKIGSDYISRESAIDAIMGMTIYCHRKFVRARAKENPVSWIGGIDDALRVIDELPSVPIREVVLCQDCKNYELADPPEGWCHAWSGTTVDDAFCSFAERVKEE